MQHKAPEFLADFDSASAMLRATANFLNGKDFPALGKHPVPLLTALVKAVDLLPKRLREEVYTISGVMESFSPDKLEKIDAEDVSRWVADSYPDRRYETVAVGSSNGALVHLCAATGMPWLPQTALYPVRHFHTDPDQPRQALAFSQCYGPKLLQANPDLQLHHMHDANQDRLMVRHMEYFRVKRRALGRTYEEFLKSRLKPGGTLLIVNCERSWPTIRLGERHYFQHGALGGAMEEEFMHGGERVADYLERYQSQVRQWDAPEPHTRSPEAEWGFEPAMREDVLRFARENHFRVEQLSFYEPEHLSPLIADFYRDWYASLGRSGQRLLVESFILLEPYWALLTGSVPFWMKFNMEPSADCLERYLTSHSAFDEIYLMLFNHGVEAAGFATIERWRGLLKHARREGRFMGLREDLYPRDFGSLARYHSALKAVQPQYSLPSPLPFQDFRNFLNDSQGRYAVKFEVLY